MRPAPQYRIQTRCAGDRWSTAFAGATSKEIAIDYAERLCKLTRTYARMGPGGTDLIVPIHERVRVRLGGETVWEKVA
jgi:hypothetical protein